MNYWNVYGDVWNFHKKHANVKNENNWDAVVEEMGQIAEKYNNSKFVNDLLVAVTSELDRTCRGS